MRMEPPVMPPVFGSSQIRRTIYNNEWWFVVEDVCRVLMDSPDGENCWRQLRQRLESEGCAAGTLCHALELPAPDGTTRLTDCINLEGVFRIVQSMASPKAELVKRWLAQAGRCEKRPQSRNSDLGAIFYMLGEATSSWIAEETRERLEREADGEGGFPGKAISG